MHADLSSGGLTLTIYANDPMYSNNTKAAPYFRCSVVNTDPTITSAYQFVATGEQPATNLANVQQQALLGIYNGCAHAA